MERGESGETARHRLLLLRHAHAASPPGVADFDRPLDERGLKEARQVGRWLRGAVGPDLVLCSPARRARETWELAEGELAASPVVRFDDRVYEANDVAELGEVIGDADDRVGTLLLVGHNPVMQDLAVRLTEATSVRERFPTGSVAVVALDDRWSNWSKLEPGTLAELFRP